MSVLLVSPSHDQATKSTKKWAERLCQKFQFSVNMMHIVPATRAEVTQRIGSYSHLFYFGHGMTDCLHIPKTVRADEILIDETILAANSIEIVVAVACWAGDTLAPAVTDNALGPMALH
jgi:hypothetical protein